MNSYTVIITECSAIPLRRDLGVTRGSGIIWSLVQTVANHEKWIVTVNEAFVQKFEAMLAASPNVVRWNKR